MNPWTCCAWKHDSNFRPKRSGLRIRIDSEVPDTIHEHCLRFAVWLRAQYEFPIRIPVYVKFKTQIKASDGELVSALFFEPYSHTVEPYAKVAVGTLDGLTDEYEIKNASYKIICSIAHELTHYFQWVNRMQLSSNRGMERQASYYGRKLADRYAAEHIWTSVELKIFEMESLDSLRPECYLALRNWASTENPSVKKMIVALVAERNDKEAKNLLLQLSNDSDASVRAYALDMLCCFPADECKQRLQEAVYAEEDTYARYCAIRSCADLMMDGVKNIDTVQSFFQAVMAKETEPLCRLGCSYALYVSGQEEALNAILNLLGLGEDDLKCEILIVLHDIAEPKNIQTIVKAVKRLQNGSCSNSLRECIHSFFQVEKDIH